MTLSINTPLLAADMLEVRDLKGGKIFLLKGRDGGSLVLKAEPRVTGEKLKAAGSVVKAIDPTIKMKPLTTGEVNELRNFLIAQKPYKRLLKLMTQMGQNCPESDLEKQTLDRLKDCINTFGSPGPGGLTSIAKLSYAHMTTLSVVLDVEGKAVTDQSWDEARETFTRFIRALNKSGGMEKLGQIMAGDFFIGNEDRFRCDGNGMSVKLYGENKRLKVLFNLGNVILVKPGKGKKTRPSMLDYMDPNTDYLDLSSDVGTIEGNKGSQWPMRVLLNNASRKKIAEDLANDLEYILKPERNLFSRKTSLGGSKAAGRIEAGIIQGIKAIKKALTAKGRANLKPLIQSYYDALQHV